MARKLTKKEMNAPMLVACMGSIWKLTYQRYIDFLSDKAAGLQTDLDDYGKMIGVPLVDVTDFDAGSAKVLLEEEGF